MDAAVVRSVFLVAAVPLVLPPGTNGEGLPVDMLVVSDLASAAEPVSVREEKLVIPTWEIGPTSASTRSTTC